MPHRMGRGGTGPAAPNPTRDGVSCNWQLEGESRGASAEVIGGPVPVVSGTKEATAGTEGVEMAFRYTLRESGGRSEHGGVHDGAFS